VGWVVIFNVREGIVMSYDAIYREEIDLHLSGHITATFTCPRCGQVSMVQFASSELLSYMEIECQKVGCPTKGGRIGFSGAFTLGFSGSYLGVTDVPLGE
jgi:predicted RNA-binding Zn-ribbon protein involved in translation (DUF1610 family)